MKKFLLTLSALFCVISAVARPNFEVGKKYAIQCAYYDMGSITLGAYHNVSPILYYYTSPDIPDVRVPVRR